MCYVVAFSTTCADDLAQDPDGHYYIVPLPQDDFAHAENLAYSNKWFLGCRYGGCSCHFWHESRLNAEPDFKPLEAWMPEEDEEDMASTAAFFDFVSSLVLKGYRVDVVDMLEDMMPQYVRSREVSIRDVPREFFRFYDGWRFDLRP